MLRHTHTRSALSWTALSGRWESMFKTWFEVKGQICIGCFPQCFARQLHNPINMVTTTQLGLYSVQAKCVCMRAWDRRCVYAPLAPDYSQNYSFPWSLDQSISRQCEKDRQGQTNIFPTFHQPITFICNHAHMNSTITNAAELGNYSTHNVLCVIPAPFHEP